MSKKQEAAQEKQRAIDALKSYYLSQVYTVLTHRSQSGMSRSIKVLCANSDGTITDLSYFVGKALGWKLDQKHGGVKVTGCGMDMGYHLVYTMSHVINKDLTSQGDAGYKIKQQWI